MREKILVCVITLMLCAHVIKAQEPVRFYATANVNLFVAFGSAKATYPIVWYSDKVDPKFMIGGMGTGVTVLKESSGKIVWKGSLQISRHAYWDEPAHLRDNNNQPLGTFVFSSVDLNAHLNMLAELPVGDHWSAGAGVGLMILLDSRSRLFDYDTGNGYKRIAVSNGTYKTIMPVIPVELSYKLKRNLIVIRYEQALLNKYGPALSDYKSERFAIVSMEYCWRIRGKEGRGFSQ